MVEKVCLSLTVDPDTKFSNHLKWGARRLELSSSEPGLPVDRALEVIRHFIVEHGQEPTAQSWQVARVSPREKAIRRRFGSFRNATERAAAIRDRDRQLKLRPELDGLGESMRKVDSVQLMLAAYIFGITGTPAGMSPCERTIRRRFGSFRAAAEAAAGGYALTGGQLSDRP
jgi:hypothetical protein